MDENGGVLPVPDSPETRQVWLGDFSDQELRDFLRTLLEAGFVQMIMKGDERGFLLTTLGRVNLDVFLSSRNLNH